MCAFVPQKLQLEKSYKMKEQFFKILNIPPLPAELEQLLEDTISKTKISTPEESLKLTNWDTNDPGYGKRVFIKDGKSIQGTRSYHHDLPEPIRDWVKKNVLDRWLFCNLAITPGTCNIHGIHTDKTRRYLIIYMIDPGGSNVITRWYQEKGFPVARTEIGHSLIKNYDEHELIEIASHIIQPKTWIAFDAKILHDAQNIVSDRIALHIGMDETFDLENWKYN